MTSLTITITQAHVLGFLVGILFVILLLLIVALWEWFTEIVADYLQDEDSDSELPDSPAITHDSHPN
jgi:hypothetical protein